VRGPRLLRLAIAALHAEREPLRMDVEARVSGRRYLEDRDTVAVLGGDKDRATEFTERWTFALDGPPPAAWRLVGTADSEV
jgi:predicted lipid-binding transport protein (Tim44 family)